MEEIFERDLERHFSKECRRLGIMTLKIMPRFARGWPDRLTAANGVVRLAELKTPKGKLSPMQTVVHGALLSVGVVVPVLRTKQEITEFLESHHGCNTQA